MGHVTGPFQFSLNSCSVIYIYLQSEIPSTGAEVKTYVQANVLKPRPVWKFKVPTCARVSKTVYDPSLQSQTK